MGVWAASESYSRSILDTFYNLGAMSGTREISNKHLLIIIVIVLYTILLLLISITLLIKCLWLNVHKTL